MNEAQDDAKQPHSAWIDAQGRRWSCAVTVRTIQRVEQLTGVRLLDVLDGNLLVRLSSDPVLLVDVLYAVVKPQADERGVSDEAFAELVVGDTIHHAWEALIQGIIDFFPSDRRAVLKRLWRATERADRAAVEMVRKKISSPAIEEAIDRIVNQASDEIDRELARFGASSGSSPASSASPPAR